MNKNRAINFRPRGAIFDVDDTLLDNKPGRPGHGLHEKSRLAAAREAGQRHNIPHLEQLSIEDNLRAFLTASEHSIQAAVWNILLMTKQVNRKTIDPHNSLLREIIARKDELYEAILRDEGEEVLGATQFIQLLTTQHNPRLAIASMGNRRNVDFFLRKTNLKDLFPDDRIKTKELVAHAKPHPEAFNLAFDSLQLPESDRQFVCAFEDDPHGIASARAAGLFTCAIGTRFTPEYLLALETPPHVALATFDEFIDWFNLDRQ